jgi:mRNA-degrading endonuclease RelE of RelBE toxin-antitoxin system
MKPSMYKDEYHPRIKKDLKKLEPQIREMKLNIVYSSK